jgi:outer membrane protein assembly factor BamB
MREKFTRRRFLSVVGAGATYLALTNAMGCGRSEREAPRAETPKGGAPSTPKVSHLPSVSPASREGAEDFRSRPDLTPPAVEVTAQAHDTASGYVFVATKRGGPAQGGSMILDDRGQVVWFRPMQGSHERAMDFKVQHYRGRPVLTWGEGRIVDGRRFNEYVILDASYREVTRFRAGNGYQGDHHEFFITPQDTALITIYHRVPGDLSAVGGPADGAVLEGIAQEIDIETGEVLFEWHSLDHVGLDESYLEPGGGHRRHFDYFHINSIDVDRDDNLLISARETSAVYKVDRTTGEVIWRLGGKKSDFEMGEGTRFAYQHDARRLPDGTISIFDNGSLVFENGLPKAVEESRGIVLGIDERQMIASLVREYTHPDEMHAHAAGNMQVLANGDVFVGWGRALAVSEFGEDGELLFDFRLPAKNKTYRAFRFPWSGHPTEQPAAAVERISEEEVRVHASWNGATEVAAWQVLTGSKPDQANKPLGSVARRGFETAIAVRTEEPYVAVQAKDASGRVLGTSKAVKPED